VLGATQVPWGRKEEEEEEEEEEEVKVTIKYIDK
jgi:hypothetical protein